MSRLRQLISEVHRRSLWQVLIVYLGASWIVLEVGDHVIERFLLPEWSYGAAFLLLLIGLPIVLATAFVREDTASRQPRDPTLLGQQPLVSPARVATFLTWPKAILGVVLALTVLALVSAVVVIRGAGRVTEAYGAAGDAFGERDWIVVADFEGPENDPGLAAAVRELVTVDLQQSGYVNVFSREQLAVVLQRMEIQADTTIDSELAREIAQREGAGAVLLGKVLPLGGTYAISARVLEPNEGRELISVGATAGKDFLADGVQALSRDLRERLGEATSSIEASEPLPRVTTRSIDALREYGLAGQLSSRGEFDEAIEHYLAAVEYDPEFAVAYYMLAAAYGNQRRQSKRQEYLNRAFELRDRVTERERLNIEGNYAGVVRSDPWEAIAKYESVLARFPDDPEAANQLGFYAAMVGDWERALTAFLRAMELRSGQVPYGNAFLAAWELQRESLADSVIALMLERGYRDRAERMRVSHAVNRRDWAEADSICGSFASGDEQRRWQCGLLAITRGKLHVGVESISRLLDRRAERGQYSQYFWGATTLAYSELLRGQERAARQHLTEALAGVPLESVPNTDWHGARFNLCVGAAIAGSIDVIEDCGIEFDDPEEWERAGMGGGGNLGASGWHLRAVRALAQRDWNQALAADQRAVKMNFDNRRVTDHLLMARAFDGLGQLDSAVVFYRQAVRPGRLGASPLWLPIVYRRLGELCADLGDRDAAARYDNAFLALWSDADPELQPQVEAVRQALVQTTAEGAGASTGACG